MSDDTGVNAEYEQQYAQYRQESKQQFDQHFNDFQQTAERGSIEDITQWKDTLQELQKSYAEAAQTDPNEEKQRAWQTAADNLDWAVQTLNGINDMDTSGFADSVRGAQEKMNNVTGERDGESDEQKESLRDHRQRAGETTARLEEMQSKASDAKRMSRQDVEQMRSDLQLLHENTYASHNEHRSVDETAGEHYDSALEHMNNANQWGEALGGCFDQTDQVVEAMRQASEALAGISIEN